MSWRNKSKVLILGQAVKTEAKTVDLSMANGNQEILPSTGKALKKATVIKPETMLPENIKKDVNIGGVIGTYEGSTSTTASTDEEMAALLSEDNEGRVIKFTGVESEIYDKNEYYLIEEDN